MRSFWGLMSAYWLSQSWREAWGLTLAILVLTALSAKASVWFAVTSGELVNRIAYFHHPTTPTTPTALLTTAATLAAIAIMRDAGFTAVRHFFSTTLHRKWREWLDRCFNEALLDSNHTHFHLQQIGSDANGSAIFAPDNVDQRIQESIKGMTGGAIGLAMGIAGVVLSLGFVGSKLIETSSEVRGLEFLGRYGSACLAFAAIAIYVPLNTFIAAKLGGILQRLSVRMQWAEGSYRTELNTLLHRSFHVAVLHGERAQKAVNKRRYIDIDQTWASQNRVTAGYMGFELVHNFIGSRIVAYAPGLLPYVDNKISLQHYVTGAELANALINECSWFIHVMPDIATLRANARRITDLAEAIETVQRPQEFYARTGPYEFLYAKQDTALGLTVRQIELLHAGVDLPFLAADELRFLPGEWTLVVGDSGSGKTSLLKAINGLWAHGRGAIMTPRHVRSLYAAQDVRLQAVSLKDLVCLPDSVDEHLDTSVAAALHKAGLGEFIEELSRDGRDGQSWDQLLSGGQKQKLVLARVLLLRPGLLFLDEATSALDTQAVHAFLHAIKDHCREATVIAVMHDVSPIQSASGVDFFDSVVTIEKGVAKKIDIAAWRLTGK
ncbi:ATP-binding cassette domain-containing protein [Rhizobium mongolense]|uniref:ATP-binding cassette domain-containing protein n=1 Tax=Rhizobium TaxID=379 RepID=UPI0024B1F191|nr:ATP-binding cassette domain-containing protein [Rhizobium sp. CC1099]WFU91831.1 ATP-binding cassette domain-containing protein [Rhizobium sp. CC1099]